jgi:hypothetical protein
MRRSSHAPGSPAFESEHQWKRASEIVEFRIDHITSRPARLLDL